MARAASRKDHPLSMRLPEADIAMTDRAAGLRGGWLKDAAEGATRIDADLHISELPRLFKCFAEDLRTMARPVLDKADQAIP